MVGIVTFLSIIFFLSKTILVRKGGNQILTPTISLVPSVKETQNCTEDSQCPSGKKCQAYQGTTTGCGQGKPCNPIEQIVKGFCKLTEEQFCQADRDCQHGLVCHSGKCTSTIPFTPCSGPSDTRCPSGYTCIQNCRPPVIRDNDPTVGYSCLLNQLAKKGRMCPVCLSSSTMIETEKGDVNVKQLQVGMNVWTMNNKGQKELQSIVKLSTMDVGKHHIVSRVILADGRALDVSPNHPLVGGRTVGELKVGDQYDNSTVQSNQTISYQDTETYDLLLAGDTGYYFANDILMGSTLK